MLIDSTTYTTYNKPTYYASNVTFDVLVNGKPIKQYEHKDKIYVEGRAKSNYSLRVKNNGYYDVLAVISVDGMCIIDGKPASEESKGWIVKGNSELVIPGWLVDNKNAAKFQFDEKKESYAAVSETGSVKNVGVIGCLIYEKKHTETYTIKKTYIPDPIYPIWPDTNPWHTPKWGSGTPYYGSGTLGGSWDHNNILRSSFSAGSNSADASSFMANACNNTMTASSASPESVELSSTTKSASRGLDSPVKHELGTGFGAKTTFKTTEETFDRGDTLKTIVLYYDSKRNLEKLGIKFESKKPKKAVEPNPFPASKNFCKPPKGW